MAAILSDQQESQDRYENPTVAARGNPLINEQSLKITLERFQGAWSMQVTEEQPAEWLTGGRIVYEKVTHTPRAGSIDTVCQDDKADIFLDATYRFSRLGLTRDAVDWIIDYLDDLQNAGRFRDCDELLRAADPRQLTDPLIVTFLGITSGAKANVPSRMHFYLRAMETVAGRRGEEGAQQLLQKYW